MVATQAYEAFRRHLRKGAPDHCDPWLHEDKLGIKQEEKDFGLPDDAEAWDEWDDWWPDSEEPPADDEEDSKEDQDPKSKPSASTTSAAAGPQDMAMFQELYASQADDDWWEDDESWNWHAYVGTDDWSEPEADISKSADGMALEQRTWTEAQRAQAALRKDRGFGHVTGKGQPRPACFKCGSTQHLARECPDRMHPQFHKGKSKGYSSFYTDYSPVYDTYMIGKGKGKPKSKSPSRPAHLHAVWKGKGKSKNKALGRPAVNAYAMEPFYMNGLEIHESLTTEHLNAASSANVSPGEALIDSGATASAGPEESVKGLIQALLSFDPGASIDVQPYVTEATPKKAPPAPFDSSRAVYADPRDPRCQIHQWPCYNQHQAEESLMVTINQAILRPEDKHQVLENDHGRFWKSQMVNAQRSRYIMAKEDVNSLDFINENDIMAAENAEDPEQDQAIDHSLLDEDYMTFNQIKDKLSYSKLVSARHQAEQVSVNEYEPTEPDTAPEPASKRARGEEDDLLHLSWVEKLQVDAALEEQAFSLNQLVRENEDILTVTFEVEATSHRQRKTSPLARALARPVELTQEPEAILPDLNPPSDPTSEANELRFCACDKRWAAESREGSDSRFFGSELVSKSRQLRADDDVKGKIVSTPRSGEMTAVVIVQGLKLLSLM
ncbi:Uncharacterized protein SCF082_LOCUS10448 [Durusdinium trenchii]|uniref:CCHC-type domain-containing protein n=1 Tax=Durusdinium trenchii TaxID=1381693 RepID=A0ABP0J6D7_9DINO